MNLDKHILARLQSSRIPKRILPTSPRGSATGVTSPPPKLDPHRQLIDEARMARALVAEGIELVDEEMKRRGK